MLLREIALRESSTQAIAEGLISNWDLGLPIGEPTRAAQRYVGLGAAEVQQAFRPWLRPDALARVTQGPAAD